MQGVGVESGARVVELRSRHAEPPQFVPEDDMQLSPIANSVTPLCLLEPVCRPFILVHRRATLGSELAAMFCTK